MHILSRWQTGTGAALEKKHLLNQLLAGRDAAIAAYEMGMAEVFYLPITSLVDDAVDIPEFIYLESIPAEDFYPRNAALDSTPHKVYDAGLKNYANLHRFLNKAGEPYSAIYVGRDERLSCERGHEQGMIDYWNQG